MVANTFVTNDKIAKKVPVGYVEENNLSEISIPSTLAYSQRFDNNQSDFQPEIQEQDCSKMDERNLAGFINKTSIWMVIKGKTDIQAAVPLTKTLNALIVLNNILCPLLLIPENWSLKSIERVVYVADLRYCRIQVVRYLADISRPWQADLSIAHFTAKGLTNLDEAYSQDMFKKEVHQKANYDQLFFNNIKENDLKVAVDVIINGMNNDMLVLVNHHFHIHEIMERQVNGKILASVTVPLLIFPY